MNLDHERAGCINHVQTTMIRFFPHRLRHAMRAENDDRPLRHFIQLFHKDGALSSERIHDVSAMDDLVTNINRSAVLLERQIHDIDRPIDTGTKPTGIGEIDLHSCRSSLAQALHGRTVKVRSYDTSDPPVPSTELTAKSPFDSVASQRRYGLRRIWNSLSLRIPAIHTSGQPTSPSLFMSCPIYSKRPRLEDPGPDHFGACQIHQPFHVFRDGMSPLPHQAFCLHRPLLHLPDLLTLSPLPRTLTVLWDFPCTRKCSSSKTNRTSCSS